MVTNVWRELQRKYPQIRLDEFVVMPNHIHSIIVIDVVGADQRVRADQRVGADLRVCPDNIEGGRGRGEHAGSPQQGLSQQGLPQQGSTKTAILGAIVQWFKTMTTNYYIRGIRDNGWTPFPGRFWQRNYYERIIRNENEMNRIREYVIGNPRRWNWDRNNPNRIQQKTRWEPTL